MPSFRHFALLYKEQGLCYSKRMSKNNEKTNVCRLLDGKKLAYVEHTYPPEEAVSAEEVAAYLGQNPAQVFKTLVTVGKSGQHYVFVIPGPASLSLKSAAKAVGEKSVAMLPQRELLPLTGYVHGGCSPIGMKKFFPTVVDESAEKFEHIILSAGKRGYQVELSTEVLSKMIRFSYAALTE